MKKDSITRVSELRELLSSYKDDDFVYCQISRGGNVSINVISDFVDGRCYISSRPIYIPPMINIDVQTLIKKHEDAIAEL